MVGDPISDNDLPLIVKAFSSALLSDYRSLSLSLSLSVCFPRKKIEFGNYLVELCKEFFGILSLLDGVVVAGVVRILRQLGNLAKYDFSISFTLFICVLYFTSLLDFLL